MENDTMKIVHAYTNKQFDDIRRLYMQAFPAAERKSFSMLRKLEKEKKCEILSIQGENEEFMGLVITVTFNDLILLDYFAVSPEKRGHGVGSEALAILKERYRDKRFFLEIETTLEPSGNAEERQNRKAFYLCNGMKLMPFMTDVFGVHMEILTNGCDIDYHDYFSVYENVLPPDLLARIHPLCE